MKQQVNLLKLLPKFEKRFFSLPILIIGEVIVIIFLMIIYWGIKRDAQHKELQLVKAQQNYQVAEAKFTEAEKQFSPEEREMAFNQKAESLNQQIEEKMKLVAVLSLQRSRNIRGFSHYLEELANKIVPGVALTEINIDEGGKLIKLEGQAVSIDTALLFASRLDRDKIFAGQTFKLSQLGEDSDSGYLTIQLSNDKNENEGAQA